MIEVKLLYNPPKNVFRMIFLGGVSFLGRRASAVLLAVLMVMSTIMIVAAPGEVEAARVSPVRTTAGWALEVIDGRNDTGFSTSLAIDQFGYSHIAYAQYDDYFLYYATNSGGSWEIEKLGGPVDPEQEISLAVDVEGKAHVLYMMYEDEFENLTYATNAGGSWVSTIIGPLVSGAYNDLFIDADGVMHVAYTVSDDSWSNNVLMYANNSGGTWNTPVLVDDIGNDTGMYCSLAVSDYGTIYIAYQVENRVEIDPGTFIFDRYLKLAHKTSGGSWSTTPLDYTSVQDNKLGYYISIAVFDDEVHISYCDQNDYDLLYKHFDGIAWLETVIVDEVGQVGECSSIGVDSKGVPHIAYYDITNGVMKMAEKVGAEWDVMVVDGESTTGDFTSLAISSDDRVRISYHDSTNGDLCLASEDAWTTDTVHPGSGAGETSSMTLDDDGNAYIAYYDYTNRDLWFATNAAGTWVTEMLDSEGDVGAQLSLDIDKDRKAHISYLDRTNSALKYTNNTDGSWSTVVLAQINSAFHQTSSLKVDSAGRVHIFFNNQSGGAMNLWYATNAAGSWAVSLFEDLDPSMYQVGNENSLFIDPSDNLHVVYKRQYLSSPSELVYANDVGGTWNYEIVATNEVYGTGSSLAVDRYGKAHISFVNQSDTSNWRLMYATNAGGSWTNETVDTHVLYTTTLDVDSKGYVHIAFAKKLETSIYALRYVTNAGGNWAHTNVGMTKGGEMRYSLVLDSGDKAHISYTDPTFGDAGFKYTTNTAWKMELVYDGPRTYAPSYSSVKVDSNGWVHICYQDTETMDLIYAKNVGGTWTHQLIDGATALVGYHNNLVLDSNGKAHISYLDATNHRLKYANNTGREWAVTALDDARIDISDQTSIAIDGNDKVYISYYATASGDLKCATNAGGPWAYCTVDDSVNDVGRYSSIAIHRVDRTSRPHISYYDATGGDLKYAVFTGTSWTTGSWTLDTIYYGTDAGKYNSLALDPQGTAYVSFYDDANDHLMVASDFKGYWDHMVVDYSGGLYSSMVRGISGELYIAYYDDINDDLKLAMNINGAYPTSGGWGIATVDCAGDVGKYPSICIGTQNIVHISYVDDTHDDLKHAQLRAEPSAPFGLTANASSDDAVLSWSAPLMNNGCAITGYVLQRTTMADGSVDPIEVGNVLSYVDAGLSDGDYSYKVAALNSIGTSAYSIKADVTIDAEVITLPGAPTSVIAYPHDEMVELVWQAPLGDGGSPVTNYKVYRGESSGALSLLGTLGNVLNYSDFGLENGHAYYYAISAVNGIGEGPQSSEVSETPMGLPSAPLNLTASLDGDDVTLNWERPSDDGGSSTLSYTVYRGETSGSLTQLIALGDVLTYIDPNIGVGQTYFYQVSAENGVGEGPMSNEVSSNPDLPSSPVLSAGSVGTTVTLTWTAPGEGSSAITNYTVYRGVDSGSMSLLIELGNVLTYEDSTGTAGSEYVYQVSAVNDHGEGPRSNSVSVLLGSVPSAPIHLGASAEGAGMVLTWDEPADDGGWNVTGYKVYRGTSATNLTLKSTLGNVLNYTDYDLVAGMEYYYAVSAVNSMGESVRSDVVMMQANSAPTAPRNLDLDAGNATVSLSWDEPTSTGGSPVTGYKIYRGTSADSLTLLTTVGLVTTYTDDTVVNGQAYYYKVSAVNALGEGPATDIEEATPTAEGGEDDDGDNTMLYIVIAIVAIAAVAGVAVFLLRRKK